MIEAIEWPPHLRDQALRAASSIVLNVAEGAGLPSQKQKAKPLQYRHGQLEVGPGGTGNQSAGRHNQNQGGCRQRCRSFVQIMPSRLDLMRLKF